MMMMTKRKKRRKADELSFSTQAWSLLTSKDISKNIVKEIPSDIPGTCDDWSRFGISLILDAKGTAASARRVELITADSQPAF